MSADLKEACLFFAPVVVTAVVFVRFGLWVLADVRATRRERAAR